MNVDIYTDGACRKNPGPGGYGVYILEGKNKKIIQGYNELTTNNAMELMGILIALKYAIKYPNNNYKIHTDSSYALNTCKTWIYSWVNNGTIHIRPNSSILKRIYKFLIELENLKVNYELIKVKGHSDNEGNNYADYLATSIIDKNLNTKI